MGLINRNDETRIEQTVRSAEAQTSAEIVVAVVRQSHGYEAARACVTGLLTVMVSLIVDRLWPLWNPAWILCAQIPIAVILWLALGVAPLHRLLISTATAKQAVHARAMQLFTERGVYRTRDRSGVLILVSELERTVEIIGDENIHSVVGEQGWTKHVQQIVTAIRSGHTAEGIIQAVRELGELLSQKFPCRPDDQNELPNEIVRP